MLSYLRRERRSHLLFHALVWTGTAVALYFILERLSAVLAPIGLALLFAYLLNPIVTKLQRKGVPRALSIIGLLAVGVFAIWLAVLLFIPLVAADLEHFADTVPKTIARLSRETIPWIERRFGVDVPDSFTEALAKSGISAGQLAGKLSTAILPMLGFTLASVPAILETLVTIILVPVFTFYFLVDFPHLKEGAANLIPPRHRATVTDIMSEIGRVVSSWVRGQLVVVTILAVLYATAMWICGIPLAIPVGILAGLLTFIPYVGTAIGFGIALLMTLMDFSTFSLAGVTVSFVGLHLLEAFVLTPVIVGKKVGLGEVGALIAILVGGELLGLVGILIAVPTAAALMVVVRRAAEAYRKSEFFTRGADEVVPQGTVAALLVGEGDDSEEAS